MFNFNLSCITSDGEIGGFKPGIDRLIAARTAKVGRAAFSNRRANILYNTCTDILEKL